MAQSDHPVVQQLEEQLEQIRERIERKERHRGGWWIVLSGLSLGALAGSVLAYYLRSRDEESPYIPPPAPPAPSRRDDAIILKAAPTPATATAPADDDQPIELKTPATPTADLASIVAAPAAAETLATVPVTAEEAIAAVEVAPATILEPEEPTPEPEIMPEPVAEATPEPLELEGQPEAAPETAEPADERPSYAGSVLPEGNQCPASHPIKGNLSRNSVLIFHLPGSNNYDRTNPEACFATEADAEAAGFRKARS